MADGEADVPREAPYRIRAARKEDIPALVAWTSDGRVMPAEHGPRLAELLPHGHYVEIADARVLVQLDRPGAVATQIRDFIQEHPLEPATSGPRRHRRGGTASS